MGNRGTKKNVRVTRDIDTPLHNDEKMMIARLAAMPASDIDYSDIPPQLTRQQVDAPRRPAACYCVAA